jgi:Spy/CpxP family protein refolding chaperone
MRTRTIICVAACLQLAAGVSAVASESPYAGQQTRDIKSMSADDIEGYLAGKGMGLARAAELNGYAGPAHVIELATQLQLTAEQRAQTESLHAAMAAKAAALGRALVEEERKLDRLFAQKTVTQESLAGTLQQIGTLQGRVRGAHLEAHLAQARILTPEQNARYAQLRGYAQASPHSGSGKEHKH